MVIAITLISRIAASSPLGMLKSNGCQSGRTTQVIAAEINMIKYQAERIYLAAAIEIGRRLTEAKAQLKDGEWGKWLEEFWKF